MAKTRVKLRAFLDAEAKRNAGGNGVKRTEPVPMKILKPRRYSLYVRLCPFCRRAAGQDSINQQETVSERLPKVRSDRSEAREPSGSIEGVEWEAALETSQDPRKPFGK